VQGLGLDTVQKGVNELKRLRLLRIDQLQSQIKTLETSVADLRSTLGLSFLEEDESMQQNQDLGNQESLKEKIENLENRCRELEESEAALREEVRKGPAGFLFCGRVHSIPHFLISCFFSHL